MMRTMRRVCVDFDGVLYQPSTADAADRLVGMIMPGAMEFVRKLRGAGWEVIIHTARASSYEATLGMTDWLRAHEFPPLPIASTKPMANLYIDDKARRFTGSFRELLAEILDER